MRKKLLFEYFKTSRKLVEYLPVSAVVNKEIDHSYSKSIVGDDGISEEVNVEIIIKHENDDLVIANDDTEGAGQFKCPQCDFAVTVVLIC